MVILFSAYALLRMQQRGIHPQEVVEAVTAALANEPPRASTRSRVSDLAVGRLRIRYRWDDQRLVVVNAMRTPLSPR